MAVIRGNLNAVKYLSSERGCDADATDANGHTPIQAATWKGADGAIEALVVRDALELRATTTE